MSNRYVGNAGYGRKCRSERRRLTGFCLIISVCLGQAERDGLTFVGGLNREVGLKRSIGRARRMMRKGVSSKWWMKVVMFRCVQA